jgi:hypothetical protein
VEGDRGADQRRLEALEELAFTLAHCIAVEAPHVGRPLALRLKLVAELQSESEEARQLFQAVARLLDPA